MSDVGDNNFIRYIYRGEEGEIIPDGATHITVAEDVTFVRARAFEGHPNIVEIICHENVEKIEEEAFIYCSTLKRVIMPGVKIVERGAFVWCAALTYVECGKLETIEEHTFGWCKYLGSINLPSVGIVEERAFYDCSNLKNVKFGNNLERFECGAFGKCTSLERITIPLKFGLITEDDTFQECVRFNHVDLVEGEILQFIAALQLEEWKNDVNEEIDSINRILRSARFGYYDYDEDEEEDYGDPGEKAQVIRGWIRSVLNNIIFYQEEHQQIMHEAATALQFTLPRDIVFNNVLPFLELPSLHVGMYQVQYQLFE